MKLMTLALSAALSTTAFAADFNGYIVKLKEGSSLMSQKSMSFDKIDEYKGLAGHFAVVKPFAGLVDSNALEELRNHPEVEYVEPNYIYSINPTTVSNVVESVKDASFDKQWGLKNTGRNSGGWFSSGKEGEDINAEKAWEITKGSREVIVAVIDTGVDHSHQDLRTQMWTNDKELNGIEGVDDDGNGFVDDVYGYDFVNNDGDPMDDNAHGTHCAGVIGAAHDGEGVMGVMANVRIMGLKFLSARGSGETIGAIKSIDYAVQMGAHVLSNSWGGGEKSQALKESIERANEKGIIFVAAAGNSRSDNDARPTYPANYKVDNVITVGSHAGKGKRSSFSNYGQETVHVFAPGSNILSTVPNGRYKKMSGTSMATPFVAGMMGLLRTKAPNMSPAQARDLVIRTSVDNGSLRGISESNGRVDAFNLVKDL